MKTLFVALELGDSDISIQETADMFGVRASDVRIMPMSQCTGSDRAFAQITDIYLWTCKYSYGLYVGKLTFLRIKGTDELNTFFRLKHSTSIRFALTSNHVGIVTKEQKQKLNAAAHASIAHFYGERIQAIRPFLPFFADAYKILFCKKDPFSSKKSSPNK